jgi:hypothetical protein
MNEDKKTYNELFNEYNYYKVNHSILVNSNDRLYKEKKELEEKYLKYKNKYTKPVYDIYGKELIEYIKSKDKDIFYSEIFYVEKINYIESLVIKNNLSYIKDIFDQYKYIELRKYNGEKTLIIGCGNRRLDNCNIDICNKPNKCDRIQHNNYHSHDNCYTIDASTVANPSIIGKFDKDIIFKTIPDHSFNYIIFEGGGIPSSNNNEIKRLLKDDELSYCIDNDNIYSYYKNGEYIIVKNNDQMNN